MYEKPPLGVMPRAIWEQLRIKALIEAMNRYASANKPIPVEWINELQELNERIVVLKNGRH